jgi:Ferredoxin subunits of nitrite reductase and ring-hydroxylating dioxygenases
MLVRVGTTLDVVSGGMVAFDVDGTPVADANVDGRLLAFDDTCTHRGCSLATGDLDGATVTCPCHGSHDVTSGAVLGGRRRRGFGRGASRSRARICSSRYERISSAAWPLLAEP